MRMEVIENGKPVPKDKARTVLLDASERFRANAALRRLERTNKRLAHAPERRSVAIAMLAVEIRLVKAFWTIARQPLGSAAPVNSRKNGIEYLHEHGETGNYKDAAGGDWSSIAPRPSLPSSKDIDAANEALDWLLLVDDEPLRKLLVVGATSKRGDAGRQINWLRIREGMPELNGVSLRTLNWRYKEALRMIVSELTLASIAL